MGGATGIGLAEAAVGQSAMVVGGVDVVEPPEGDAQAIVDFRRITRG